MKRLTVVTAGVLAAAALLCGRLVAAPGDGLYSHPGKLVRIGSTTLNLNCVGSGSPTVVFDAGWEDWSPAWAFVQPAIAMRTRTCSYDRAGAGFSSAGPMPRTSIEIARELHAALHAANIRGPYLLVGHSFGSYNMRTFADLYMPDVYGLVLVDGESYDLESPQARAAMASQFAPVLAGLRACRDAIVANRPLPMLPVSSGTKPAHCNQQFFRGLPERTFSSQLNDAVLHITLTKPALYDEVISEAEQMPADETYLIAHVPAFGSRPVRILTAQNHFYDTASTPAATHRRHQQDEQKIAKEQARWLALSSNSKQIFAYKSGHYIELDQPYLVIDAIQDELGEHH